MKKGKIVKKFLDLILRLELKMKHILKHIYLFGSRARNEMKLLKKNKTLQLIAKSTRFIYLMLVSICASVIGGVILQKSCNSIGNYEISEDRKIIKLLNKYGSTIGTKFIKSKITEVHIVDLNNDDANELIIGTASDGEDIGKIYVLTTGLKELCSFETGGKGPYWPDNKLNVSKIFVDDLDNDGMKEIISISNHSLWYPSRVVLMNWKCEKRGEYWNPGHLAFLSTVDLDNDGIKEVIIGGINNDLRQILGDGLYWSVIFALDIKNISGQAPPYFGDLKKAQKGTHLWYGYFEKLPGGEEGLSSMVIEDEDNLIRVDLMEGRIFYLGFDGTVRKIGIGDKLYKQYGEEVNYFIKEYKGGYKEHFIVYDKVKK
jgi:hypothetical protein